MTMLDEIAAERKRLRLTRPEPSESQVQREVLHVLERHPKVAIVWRQNSGVANLKGFRVAFGGVGHPDVMAILKDGGRFLAVECKRLSTKPSNEQEAWLDRAKRAGALTVVARRAEDVLEALA